METFCRVFGFPDVPFFVLVIRHLDRLYVDYSTEKAADQNGHKNSGKT